ncbi:MAG: hypothetical protein AAF456_01805 [Planctomycetota bacterium]
MNRSFRPQSRVRSYKLRRKSRGCFCSYTPLEERRVLAAISGFDSGELSISLTEDNDSAWVSTDGGYVTVNGSRDLDSTTAGVQEYQLEELSSLVINGNPGMLNQSVTLDGEYSTGDLENLEVINVGSISIPGSYVVAGDLRLHLVGQAGGINDADSGQLIVEGVTTINSGESEVSLDNGTHDFQGEVSIRTSARTLTGTPVDWSNFEISDANDILFSRAAIWGNLKVSAPNGSVSDLPVTQFSVAGDATFDVDSMTLGEHVDDQTDFFRLIVNAAGHVEVHEDDNVIFGGSSYVGSLMIESEAGGIFDGRSTSLVVDGNAEFRADRIRIGEHISDTFTAGSITFDSTGHVDFFEDDSTHIVGTNTARTLDITSQGDLTDSPDTTIAVQFGAGLEADNIYLGDSADDSLTLGSFYFHSDGDLFLNSESDIRIVDSKNQAGTLHLNAIGSITDADDASVTVNGTAWLVATDEITIGDTLQDDFNAGAIQWSSGQRALIHEDSDTTLINEFSEITASPAADISSAGLINNMPGLRLNIAGTASFTGTDIFLGIPEVDSINFGSLTVNTPGGTGEARVIENSDTILTGASLVRRLELTSDGTIADSDIAETFVTGLARFTADAITLGDTSSFNSGTLNIDSPGNVFVNEGSDIVLSGTSRANSLTLNASGNLLDAADAQTYVEFLLDVSGNLINLGVGETDFLSFSSLTFRSTGNTNIVQDAFAGLSGLTLVGNSLAGDKLILESTGDILDDDEAETVAVNQANFTGMDVIIGDSDLDCFEVMLGGDANVFVNAGGEESVTSGC